ncbi:MAG: putative 2OG-Fe(II) oxygenase [Cyanobacteriota bacterium]|nr:putative 2OG-Fe(II) oxygenase [Cyanobacteriota bacterium]
MEATHGQGLQVQPLFPLAVGLVQRRPDPLDLAIQIQEIRALQNGANSNPDPGCAWTGDLNCCWQLHRNTCFQPLLKELIAFVGTYLDELGFNRQALVLHLQRCWPVVSEPGQVVGRHHHPNAHLSGVYYLTGNGTPRSGCLRLFPLRQANELVPGLGVGHGGPIGADSPGARRWIAPWHDISPLAGQLVVFPASIDHCVLENRDSESRISLSFDLVLSAPHAQEGGAPPEYLAPHPLDWQPIGEDGPLSA